jgi:hypothetical protein
MFGTPLLGPYQRDCLVVRMAVKAHCKLDGGVGDRANPAIMGVSNCSCAVEARQLLRCNCLIEDAVCDPALRRVCHAWSLSATLLICQRSFEVYGSHRRVIATLGAEPLTSHARAMQVPRFVSRQLVCTWYIQVGQHQPCVVDASIKFNQMMT